MTSNQPSSRRPSALMRLRARVAETGATAIFSSEARRFHRPPVRLQRPVNDNRVPFRLVVVRALAIGATAAMLVYVLLS